MYRAISSSLVLRYQASPHGFKRRKFASAFAALPLLILRCRLRRAASRGQRRLSRHLTIAVRRCSVRTLLQVLCTVYAAHYHTWFRPQCCGSGSRFASYLAENAPPHLPVASLH